MNARTDASIPRVGGHKIEHVWAYIAVAAPGQVDEGVIGMMTSHGWLPLVSSDEERRDLLRPYAEMIAKTTGAVVELRRFDGPMTVEAVIAP